MQRVMLVVCVIISGMLVLPVDARQDTGFEFLTFGVGARGSGMGEVSVAIAEGVAAMYWDPAGLGFADKKEVMLMYNNMYASMVDDDMYHNFAGYIQPFDNGAVGIAYNCLYSGAHPITEYDEYTHQIKIIDRFDTRDWYVMLSCGMKINPMIAIGGNVKYLNSQFYYIHSKIYAADIGLLVRLNNRLSIGAMIENIGNKVYYIDKPQVDVLPCNFKIGVSYRYDDFVVASDISKYLYDKFIGVNIGIESMLTENIVARVGYFDKGAGLKGVTYGIGVRYNTWYIDLANIPGGGLGRCYKVGIGKIF